MSNVIIIASFVVFVSVSYHQHQANALHCLVIRPGYGLTSEKCPRHSIACRVRIEKNSIVWYQNKLYDRNMFACVMPHEYQPERKSGCKRQRSGSVRCWCYGQSNCNNPENSRKLYKAFAKGDPDELERVIEEIETSDVSDYNYNEPLLKINEPIDMDDDSSEVVAESKERSHSRTHDRHRSSAEVKKSAGNEERPSEHQVKISPTKLFEHPKKVEEHHHHRDSKEVHNSDHHDTVKSITPVTHRPTETEQKPEPRARLGFMYERPDDADSDALSEDQADSSESLYTESVAVIRTLPTDKTSKASKKTKSTRTQHTEQEEAVEKEEERKPFEAVELPSERQKDYLENDHRMRSSAANSLLRTNIFASFLVISLCWFFA